MFAHLPCPHTSEEKRDKEGDVFELEVMNEKDEKDTKKWIINSSCIYLSLHALVCHMLFSFQSNCLLFFLCLSD
jgi:hypothetical protein